MGESKAGPAPGGLDALAAEGVAPWLGGLRRSLVTSGRLPELLTGAGLRGASFGPEGLAADAAEDDGCREQLSLLARRPAAPDTAVLALSAYDLRSACDVLRPVFDAGHGSDGCVSMDVDAALAHDADGTVAAAEELHRAARRSNALVKIPATGRGLTAVRACLGRGIGVHVTEIFSARRYGQALDACLDGLEDARAAGHDLAALPVCTSLAAGRIEAGIDARLTALGTPDALALRGTAALAVARLAYRLYEERLGTACWRRLAAAGARPPRPLWEAAGGDAGRELRHAETLVAWGTGVVLSPAALAAAAAGARPEGDTLTCRHREAAALVEEVERLGVSFEDTAAELAGDRLERLTDAWRVLRRVVGEQLRVGRR
ncbi:transaldolase family protein [Streptomyces luteireticuli]|uniref:transaldolase family protein n=1 Tax=Streptomyces luteireticuli TaxID=173858 RepID=UPI003555CFCD